MLHPARVLGGGEHEMPGYRPVGWGNRGWTWCVWFGTGRAEAQPGPGLEGNGSPGRLSGGGGGH